MIDIQWVPIDVMCDVVGITNTTDATGDLTVKPQTAKKISGAEIFGVLKKKSSKVV